MKKNICNLFVITVLVFVIGYFLHPMNVYAASAKCNSIFGDENDEGSTLYYLQIIFNVMKYLSLAMLLVFSVKDFFVAMINQDEKQVKKAFPKFLKRAIYVVLIFLLPVIVKFIIGIFGKLEDPTCSIF